MATHTAQPLMERLRQMSKCSPPAKPRWEQSKHRCPLRRRDLRARVTVPTRCLLLLARRMARIRQERAGASHTAQPVMDRSPLAAMDLLGTDPRLLAARRAVVAEAMAGHPRRLLLLLSLRMIPMIRASTRPTSVAVRGMSLNTGRDAESSRQTWLMRQLQSGTLMSTIYFENT